ncbi:malectin [Occallatibacter riparius]|uniref:Malectin n=1 Tax=Occallatibacter riparius TaxID=1002689 RepID=A0A9J7BUQ6_9BACT|nr:malectin [Occallatibacter riparius]UWZ85490.1 malectin [Occallatibacter riparius]
MASGSTIPVMHVEEREELAAVLRSKEFARAPRLAQFLEYLCEKLFAGETGQIKEYSIGVELFGRGVEFDQESDSIVRVEANRLRKRLAEYYATEGADHAMQIAIPLGQYVPEFVTKAGPVPVVAEVHVPPAETRAGIRWIWIAGIAGVVVLAAVVFAAIWWGRPRQPREAAAPVAAGEKPAAFPPELGTGLPSGDEIRILCGGPRSLVDHAGKLWASDERFTGGTAIKGTVQHIWRTQDPAFYRTSRQGNFRYDLPLRPGVYELRLHFAETEFGPESTGTGGEGDRIMTVRANGKTLLSDFDVAADAGASRTADVKVFPDISPAKDGQLHLEFSGEAGKQAAISAIEIVPGQKGHMRPVRILARQTPYYSNDSQWWSPDAYFEGGQLAAYATPVSGTDDQELYDSERWGNFSYAVPVAPGRYTVTLHFAARHGEWPPFSTGGSKAEHVFDVYCNGKVLLKDFDLSREARQSDVVVRRAAGLEPNAQGKLMLTFVPVQGYATVTGIEVVAQ